MEVLTHATTWMNLEDITFSEINQPRKDKHCKIPLIRSSQICRDRKQDGGYQGKWGMRGCFTGTEPVMKDEQSSGERCDDGLQQCEQTEHYI